MEVDQNPDVLEVVAETHVTEELVEPEQPKSEELDVVTTAQNPPEPEKPDVNDLKPEIEPEEQTPEVELAKEIASPESTIEPEKVPEMEEIAEKVLEKAVEVEKNLANEVVEQKIIEPEEKAETEQKVHPEEAANAEPTASKPTVENEAAEQTEPKPEEETEKLSEAQAEPPKELETQAKEPALPQFYGWFLLPEVAEKMNCSMLEFLKTLETLEAFKKHMSDFTGEADKEVDLEKYFQTKTLLHCTTKFCDYGKAEGAKDYSELQVVQESYDTATELSVVGLIVTPRTFGARVSLTPEQLLLWPMGADTIGIPPADLPSVEGLPAGSRAHVTLACATGVEAVQTGVDLLEILILLQGEEKAATVEELEQGTLSYLGNGRWYLTLSEPVLCDATFSSFSEEQRPTEATKKEGGEKKKKPKCSIL